ncbi:MAG: NUDIX domain-containing protein, partial [Bacteroidota bacterium]
MRAETKTATRMRSEFTQVVAGVIFKDEQLLVCRRNKGKKQAGLWEFPGGKVEENESHSEALIREIKEELNLDIKVEKFLIK